MGVHTCDKRQTKTYIQDTYGDIMEIVPRFEEEDELWQANHRETDEELDTRTKVALDFIFNGKETCTRDPPACSETLVDFIQSRRVRYVS
jgi:hypothetical protein